MASLVRYANIFASCGGAVANAQQRFLGVGRDQRAVFVEDDQRWLEAERRQMEKTLESFEKMPAAQRAECISAFAKFASMNAPQRAEFLKNAARWSEMSPAERQTWRDLVVNVPQWPPMPIGFVMSTPESGTATNHN